MKLVKLDAASRNKNLGMITGVAQHEETGAIQVFLKLYAVFAKTDAKSPQKVALTSKEVIIPYEQLDTCFLQKVVVQHEPSVHEAPINPRFYCDQAYDVDGKLVPLSSIPPHPTQHSKFDLTAIRQAEEMGIRIIRLFVELYIDAFGVYAKKGYSPEGMYITFGNLTRQERNRFENIWCVGMKPPKTSTHECLKGFIEDIQLLQRGFYVCINDEVVFVTGALGIVKAGNMFVLFFG